MLFFLFFILTRLRRFDLFFTPKINKTLHKMCILRNVTHWLNLTISKISHKKFHEFSIFFAKNFFRFYIFAFPQIYDLRLCAYMYIYFFILFFSISIFPYSFKPFLSFFPSKNIKKKRIFFPPLPRSFCLKNEIKKIFQQLGCNLFLSFFAFFVNHFFIFLKN